MAIGKCNICGLTTTVEYFDDQWICDDCYYEKDSLMNDDNWIEESGDLDGEL